MQKTLGSINVQLDSYASEMFTNPHTTSRKLLPAQEQHDQEQRDLRFIHGHTVLERLNPTFSDKNDNTRGMYQIDHLNQPRPKKSLSQTFTQHSIARECIPCLRDAGNSEKTRRIERHEVRIGRAAAPQSSDSPMDSRKGKAREHRGLLTPCGETTCRVSPTPTNGPSVRRHVSPLTQNWRNSARMVDFVP